MVSTAVTAQVQWCCPANRLRLWGAAQAHSGQEQATIRADASGEGPRQQLSGLQADIMQGLGIGAMPTQILCTTELRDGAIVPVLPEWVFEPLDVRMIYPFELNFSTLISAFYEASCDIIVENIARA
jgi:hypothetical protein